MGRNKADCSAVRNALRKSLDCRANGVSGGGHLVTWEWVAAFINQGSPTAMQLACLGELWPPESGWRARVIGTRITQELRKRFESASKRKKPAAPRKSVEPKRDWRWTFGRCKGMRLDETPADYLEWVGVNFTEGFVKTSALAELRRRRQEELGVVEEEPERRGRRRDKLADEFAAIIGPNPKPQLLNPETRAIEACPFDVGRRVEPETFKGVG